MTFNIFIMLCFIAQWKNIEADIIRTEFSLQAGNPLGACITNEYVLGSATTTLPPTPPPTTKPTSAATSATTTTPAIATTTTPATTVTTKPPTTTLPATTTKLLNSTTTIPMTTATTFKCDPPFKVVGTWCYLIDTSLSDNGFWDSSSHCGDYNVDAHPVQIETAEENAAVASFLLTNGKADGVYYINHYFSSGVKKWQVFTTLDNGDPYNTFSALPATPVLDASKDWCMMIDNKGAWSFSDCSKKALVLCEMY